MIEPTTLASGGNGSVIFPWGLYRHAFPTVYTTTIAITKNKPVFFRWKFTFTSKLKTAHNIGDPSMGLVNKVYMCFVMAAFHIDVNVNLHPLMSYSIFAIAVVMVYTVGERVPIRTPWEITEPFLPEAKVVGSILSFTLSSFMAMVMQMTLLFSIWNMWDNTFVFFAYISIITRFFIYVLICTRDDRDIQRDDCGIRVEATSVLEDLNEWWSCLWLRYY